jgi:molybdopterin-containing oxidoreductase family iron-sulfur binding subunit
LQQLLAKYPNARWHQFEAINDDNSMLGAQLAFRADLVLAYDFTKADVILSLDADFLVDGPSRLINARQFAERRKTLSANAQMNRLYVIETSRTLTGASADHRLPVGPRDVVSFAIDVAAALGLHVSTNVAGSGLIPRTWIDAVVEDLSTSRGRSVVLVGRGQPPVVHAIGHWLNATLGNIGATAFFRKPVAPRADSHAESLSALVNAMRGGAVEALIALGGNPAYDGPGDLKFSEAAKKVPFSVHLSEYANETSAVCVWHVPRSHLLESWSDTRAADGTLSIVQPLIAPLYKSKTDHELLAALLGNPVATSHDLVHDFWRQQHEAAKRPGSFDATWNKWLHDGIAPDTALPIESPSMRSDF